MRTILAAILAMIAVPAIAQPSGAPEYQQPGVLRPLFPPPPHPGLLQPPVPNTTPVQQPPQNPVLQPGQRLQAPTGSNTRIPSANASGLAPPPAGYVWQRNGSDAVLVNTQTGAIIRVRHHAF